MTHADLRALAGDTPSAWTPVPQADGSVIVFAGVRKMCRFTPEFADAATFIVFARRYFDARTERELRALREVVLEAGRIAQSEKNGYQRQLLADFGGYLKTILGEMEGAEP